MRENTQPSKRETIGLGAICAAMGGYFILVALGVVPSPGAAKAPMWIVFCCGLAFFLGGIGVMTPALVTGEVRNDGELPAGAPQWLRLMQYLLGLALFATFAAIGTWVAIGGGARSFSFSGFFMTSGGGETVGRIVFGIGAVITWLCTIGFAVAGWRKLVRKA